MRVSELKDLRTSSGHGCKWRGTGSVIPTERLVAALERGKLCRNNLFLALLGQVICYAIAILTVAAKAVGVAV